MPQKLQLDYNPNDFSSDFLINAVSNYNNLSDSDRSQYTDESPFTSLSMSLENINDSASNVGFTNYITGKKAFGPTVHVSKESREMLQRSKTPDPDELRRRISEKEPLFRVGESIPVYDPSSGLTPQQFWSQQPSFAYAGLKNVIYGNSSSQEEEIEESDNIQQSTAQKSATVFSFSPGYSPYPFSSQSASVETPSFYSDTQSIADLMGSWISGEDMTGVTRDPKTGLTPIQGMMASTTLSDGSKDLSRGQMATRGGLSAPTPVGSAAHAAQAAGMSGMAAAASASAQGEAAAMGMKGVGGTAGEGWKKGGKVTDQMNSLQSGGKVQNTQFPTPRKLSDLEQGIVNSLKGENSKIHVLRSNDGHFLGAVDLNNLDSHFIPDMNSLDISLGIIKPYEIGILSDNRTSNQLNYKRNWHNRDKKIQQRMKARTREQYELYERTKGPSAAAISEPAKDDQRAIELFAKQRRGEQLDYEAEREGDSIRAARIADRRDLTERGIEPLESGKLSPYKESSRPVRPARSTPEPIDARPVVGGTVGGPAVRYDYEGVRYPEDQRPSQLLGPIPTEVPYRSRQRDLEEEGAFDREAYRSKLWSDQERELPGGVERIPIPVRRIEQEQPLMESQPVSVQDIPAGEQHKEDPFINIPLVDPESIARRSFVEPAEESSIEINKQDYFDEIVRPLEFNTQYYKSKKHFNEKRDQYIGYLDSIQEEEKQDAEEKGEVYTPTFTTFGPGFTVTGDHVGVGMNKDDVEEGALRKWKYAIESSKKLLENDDHPSAMVLAEMIYQMGEESVVLFKDMLAALIDRNGEQAKKHALYNRDGSKTKWHSQMENSGRAVAVADRLEESLSSDKNLQVIIDPKNLQVGGQVPQINRSGLIQGEGGPTSDSIPMQAEPNSFIVNAPAVQMAGGAKKLDSMVNAVQKQQQTSGFNQFGNPVTGTQDINVSNGEYKIGKQAAKNIGYKKLNKLNNAGKPFVDQLDQRGYQVGGITSGFTEQEENLLNYHRDNLFGDKYLQNPDGTITTLFGKILTDQQGTAYLIPGYDSETRTKMSDEAAWKHALETGIENYPSYPSVDEARQAEIKLHEKIDQDMQEFLRPVNLLDVKPGKKDSFMSQPTRTLEDFYPDKKVKTGEKSFRETVQEIQPMN